ncbi:MAG: amidohydrolase family protein [Anaerolineales bacterium]|jgi:predicted TIM-barrel fold metal-dependent hydrolase
MKLDLTNLKIVDDHCHPFDPKREDKGFEQYWTLSMLPIPPMDMKNTLLYRLVLKELGGFLELGPGATEDEILHKRNELYKGNPKGYLDRLFRAAHIDTLILDIGYPAEEFTGYSVDIDQFTSLLPGSMARIIVRIEPIIFRLLSQDLVFAEFVDKFNTTLDEDIRKHRAVALKTVIAYLTGLEIKKVSRDDAAKAYDAYRADKSNKAAEKGMRDYLVLQTLEACIRYDIPLQMHTGMGDSPLIDVRLSNPLLLFGMFSDEHYGKAKYVIVHAGYPYTGETGFLVNNYPNVWVDISEMNPFAGIGIEPKLLELMEMAPMTKIMYGSDGYNIPELFWFASVYLKKSLGRALDRLIENDTMDEAYARQVAAWILGENAKRLYRL